MATRSLSSAFKTALQATNCFPVFFVEIQLNTTIWRFWTGYNDITWNSLVWYGNGGLVSIANIQEATTPKGRKVKITLEGASGVMLSLILNEAHVNQIGKIYFGLLDANYGSVISDPHLAFEGKLSNVSIEHSSSDCTVDMNYESELIILNTATNYKYDNETQKNFYGWDVGFNHVAQVAEWNGYWGVK